MQTSENIAANLAKEIRRVAELPHSNFKLRQLSALRDELSRTCGVKAADAEAFLAGFVVLRNRHVKRLSHG